jgi:hypothetical protein
LQLIQAAADLFWRVCACERDGSGAAHGSDRRAVAYKKPHVALEAKIALYYRAGANHDSRCIAGTPMKEPEKFAAVFVDEDSTFDV